MSNQATFNAASVHSPNETSNSEALEQMDRALLVAEKIRDYSDEIYMYTRQYVCLHHSGTLHSRGRELTYD